MWNIKDIIFENSFILDIRENPNKIIITLDAAINNQNKNVITDLVELKFDNIVKYEWVEKKMRPIYSKNGEIDYGNIDIFSFAEDRYLLEGE